MTKKQQQEHARLRRKWATGKATRREILRCTELDRKAKHEYNEAKIIERTRAARCLIDSTPNRTRALEVAAFMAIFHPDYSPEKTRALIEDVKQRGRK